jgi:hypothetical protein
VGASGCGQGGRRLREGQPLLDPLLKEHHRVPTGDIRSIFFKGITASAIHRILHARISLSSTIYGLFCQTALSRPAMNCCVACVCPGERRDQRLRGNELPDAVNGVPTECSGIAASGLAALPTDAMTIDRAQLNDWVQ